MSAAGAQEVAKPAGAANADPAQGGGARAQGRGVKRPLDDSDDDDPTKARIFGPYQEQPPTFKFMAAETLSSALEPHIAAVEEACTGTFSMSDEGDFFPGTQCRVCSLQSPTEAGLQAGMKQLLAVALKSGDSIATPNGDYHFICILPAKSVAMMLGPKGVNMKQLEGESGVHVHIEGDALGYSTGLGPSLDRKCTLKGTALSVEKALPRLVECTVAFQHHPWYPKWACRTSEERAEMYVAGEPVTRHKGGKGGGSAPRVVLPPGMQLDGTVGVMMAPGGAGAGPRLVLPPGGCVGGMPQQMSGGCVAGGSGCMGMAGTMGGGAMGGCMLAPVGSGLDGGMGGCAGGAACGGMGGGMAACMGGGMAAGMGGGMVAGMGDGMAAMGAMAPMGMANPMMANMMAANMGMMAMCGMGGMGGMVPMGMMNPMMMMNPMACMMPAMMAAMASQAEGGAEAKSGEEGGGT